MKAIKTLLALSVLTLSSSYAQSECSKVSSVEFLTPQVMDTPGTTRIVLVNKTDVYTDNSAFAMAAMNAKSAGQSICVDYGASYDAKIDGRRVSVSAQKWWIK